MRDLATTYRTVGGHPIASLAELQRYAYAVPEAALPARTLTKLTAGEDVGPEALHHAVTVEGPDSLRDSDEESAGLSALAVIRERLEKKFPDLRS